MLSIEDVSYEVQKSAILTFASLVNKMCVNRRCLPETIEKYIRVYVDKFTGSAFFLPKFKLIQPAVQKLKMLCNDIFQKVRPMKNRCCI